MKTTRQLILTLLSPNLIPSLLLPLKLIWYNFQKVALRQVQALRFSRLWIWWPPQEHGIELREYWHSQRTGDTALPASLPFQPQLLVTVWNFPANGTCIKWSFQTLKNNIMEHIFQKQLFHLLQFTWIRSSTCVWHKWRAA